VVADKVSVDPSHTGELEVTTAAAGIGFIVTLIVPAGPVHPPTIAETE
jgi:hypothetical protein